MQRRHEAWIVFAQNNSLLFDRLTELIFNGQSLNRITHEVSGRARCRMGRTYSTYYMYILRAQCLSNDEKMFLYMYI